MTRIAPITLLAGSLIGLSGCTLGPTELGIILAIVIVLFGASRLPSLGRALGETLKNFRKSMATDDDTPTKQLPDNPPDQIEEAQVAPRKGNSDGQEPS